MEQTTYSELCSREIERVRQASAVSSQEIFRHLVAAQEEIAREKELAISKIREDVAAILESTRVELSRIDYHAIAFDHFVAGEEHLARATLLAAESTEKLNAKIHKLWNDHNYTECTAYMLKSPSQYIGITPRGGCCTLDRKQIGGYVCDYPGEIYGRQSIINRCSYNCNKHSYSEEDSPSMFMKLFSREILDQRLLSIILPGNSDWIESKKYPWVDMLRPAISAGKLILLPISAFAYYYYATGDEQCLELLKRL